MDKNTIYGLLLMAAVFLGFMWLSPKNDNPTEPQKEPEAKEAQTAAKGADALSPEEKGWLVNNINTNGQKRYSIMSLVPLKPKRSKSTKYIEK